MAEYCCPVWQRSTHVSLVDAQLHSSMHLVSGTVRSTPYSITMVARSHKYWATSCHRQVYNAGWMSPWLAIMWWHLSPSSTSPGIAQTIVEGLAVNWCHKLVPHNPTSRFWSSPLSVVTAESFLDRPWPLMRATRNGVSPTTNYVTVEKSRQCHTSSTLVHWPNLTAVYCAYMKQMSLPSTGWQHMALSTR